MGRGTTSDTVANGAQVSAGINVHFGTENAPTIWCVYAKLKTAADITVQWSPSGDGVNFYNLQDPNNAYGTNPTIIASGQSTSGLHANITSMAGAPGYYRLALSVVQADATSVIKWFIH